MPHGQYKVIITLTGLYRAMVVKTRSVVNIRPSRMKLEFVLIMNKSELSGLI